MSFRIIESAVCAAAAVIPISYLALSREYLLATAPDTVLFQLVGVLLSDVRANIMGLLIPMFFCLGELLFYYAMFRAKLVPRFISVWGLVSVLLVIFLCLYPLNESIKMHFALPIILNEIFLGVWLIGKGVYGRI